MPANQGIRRELVFVGSVEDLRSRVREYISRMDATARFTGDSAVVSTGRSVAGHPDEISWKARIRFEGGGLSIHADLQGFPWTRARRRRIVEARLNELAAFLGGDEHAVCRRRFAAVAPGTRGLCGAVAGWAAQLAAAWLGALVPMIGAGLLLTGRVIRELDVRARTLDQLGEPSLPTVDELSAIDFGFRLGAAFILAFPISFMVGFFTAAAHALGDVVPAVSRWTGGALVLVTAVLLAGFASAMHPVSAVLFALAIPACAQAALSAVWSLRRETEARGNRPRWAKSAAGVVWVFVLAAAVAPWPGGARRPRLSRFKDVFLLGNPVGREAAAFYYRHTLYVAETYKPDFSNPFTAERRDPGFRRTVLTTRKGLPFRRLGLVPESCGVADASERIREGVHDFYVLADSAKLREAVKKTGLEGRALFISKSISAEELAAKMEPLGSEAKSLRVLNSVALQVLFFGGPLALLWIALGIGGAVALRIRRLEPAVLLLPAAGLAGWAAFVVWSHAGLRSEDDPSVLANALRGGDARARYEAVHRAALLLPSIEERDEELFRELITAAKDPDVRVRTWAPLALSRFGDRRAGPALIRSLRDDELIVRYRAAAALREMPAPEAGAALRERLNHDGWYVQMHALAALRRLGLRP